LYSEAEKSLKDYAEKMIIGIANGCYTKQQRAVRTETIDGDNDLEANFYVLRHTKCPAVLTENLFQDNKEDVAFLMSVKGIQAIVELHIKGIIKYFERL